MNSTSRDYEIFLQDVTKNFLKNKPVFEAAEEQARRKAIMELELIERHSSACPVYAQSEYRINISSLDEEGIKSAMGEQFYNPEVMKAAACAIDAIFYGIPDSQGTISLNEAIRNYLTDLKTLSSGIQGVTAKAQIKDVNDMCVVKFPKHGADDDLRHELFVTTVNGGINSLREGEDGVPNFAYVFGGLRGPMPAVDPDTKQIVSWFSDMEPTSVPYILMENISPAVNGVEYIKTATVKQALSMYFQAIFALNYAHRKIDFTHYDAHNENLLMRDISKSGMGSNFVIPYTTANGNVFYVWADRVATFIDFGMAGIRHGGTYFGIPQVKWIRNAQYNDHSWPLHDAYKLLMFLIMDAQEAGNRPVMNELAKIFRFFNKTEDPFKVALFKPSGDKTSQWYHRFSLPYTDKNTQFTLTDLLRYMFGAVDHKGVVFKTPPTGVKVLECNQCYTFNSISQTIGAENSIPQPKTFFEFYDVGNYIHNRNPDDYEVMSSNFDYETARQQWYTEIDDYKNQARDLRAGAQRVNLAVFPVLRLGTLKLVQSSYKNIYSLVRILESMLTHLKVARWMSLSFDDQQLAQDVVHIRKEVLAYNGVLCELIGNAVDNYVIIEQTLHTPEWKEAVARNSKLRWYGESAGDIMALQNRACKSEVVPRILAKTDIKPLPALPRMAKSEPEPPTSPDFSIYRTSPRSQISRAAPQYSAYGF